MCITACWRARYPVLYLILLAWLPCLRGDSQRKQCVDRWTLVVMMLVLGAGSCGLLAVFWNFTSDTAFLFFFLIFQVGFFSRSRRPSVVATPIRRSYSRCPVFASWCWCWVGHADQPRSFCVATHQASGTDCMTSVLFYPICSSFPPVFISALIIGETGTSIVAAVLSAAQVGLFEAIFVNSSHATTRPDTTYRRGID